MSYDDIRKQLDLLLGPNRDGVQREAPPTSFKDPRVCKYYLCGVCPHLLFSNTKADVGPCDKVHDDNLRKQYEDARRQGEHFGYEEELERFCKKLISDVDRRIERAMRRLQVQYGIENEKATDLLAYYPGPGRTLLGVIDEEGKEDLEKGVGGMIGQTEHYYSDRDDEAEDEELESRSGEQTRSRTSLSTKGIKILAVDGSSIENSSQTVPSNEQHDSNQSVEKLESTEVSNRDVQPGSKDIDPGKKHHSEYTNEDESLEHETKEVAELKQDSTTNVLGKEHSTASSSSPISEAAEVWKEAKSPDGRSYWYNVVTRESRWQPPVGVKLVPIASVRSTTSEGSHNTATNDSLLSGDVSANQQKLRVCAECGAFLSIFDSSRRLVDHFNGKMHMGFVTLRKKVKELEEDCHRMRVSNNSRNFRTSRRRDDFSLERSDFRHSESRRKRSHHSRSPQHHHSKRYRSPSCGSSDEERIRRSSHSYHHSRSSGSHRHRYR
ncbi:Luc7-like protein 3 [Galdieria sulphuraria]|uniref:WW domain-containing protein n=1 Tax=Galdieria sulphuraria TaxID=130081 RepID=M2Y9V9_GALSU|nr:uncharacterized protein Gasu_00410 [Galdieria sulphuraria]EME32669.1 hypothetical protein Gasu_00410 [Galdieria sulphuraria]GJD07872.1 Luc7-like protein 3 [Galdieria sulphuraria]|eukprot:XP_005709189.1 hypothetical protein Gasu_00410 [Galdieria sulphuraria]